MTSCQCAVAEDAAGPFEVEGVQRVADARAAGPVGHLARDFAERAIEVLLAEPPRDAREPRAERERFDALLERVREAVREEQQEARVTLPSSRSPRQ